MATWKYEKDTRIDMGYYDGFVPAKIKFEFNTTSDSGYFFVEAGNYHNDYGGFTLPELKEMYEILKEFEKGYGF
jgi:hypothetical protein